MMCSTVSAHAVAACVMHALLQRRSLAPSMVALDRSKSAQFGGGLSFFIFIVDWRIFDGENHDDRTLLATILSPRSLDRNKGTLIGSIARGLRGSRQRLLLFSRTSP
ncbi:hypothetical protein ACOSQ3_026460 [Xanthoceras sorbifolium]